jgi:hypothetical protein
MSPIDLSNYVDVKERIRQFYERFPDGRLVTIGVKVSDEPDGTPRVWVEAAAYRTPDDALPGRGWSWMVLPGNTNYTRGSEIENTETSAWGRAIGALGIGIAAGIASQDEVRAKEGEADRPAPMARPAIEPQSNGSIYGVVQVKPEWLSDLEMRSTPTGAVIGFRLKDGRRSIKVQAHGALAIALAAVRSRDGRSDGDVLGRDGYLGVHTEGHDSPGVLPDPAPEADQRPVRRVPFAWRPRGTSGGSRRGR